MNDLKRHYFNIESAIDNADDTYNIIMTARGSGSGYNGCKNCKHQIEPLRACEWLEHGGDGRIHLICPKWDMKGEQNE